MHVLLHKHTQHTTTTTHSQLTPHTHTHTHTATISPDHKPCNRNHKHYLNHTHHTNGTNHRLSLQKCVPYQIAYSAHQKVHHPLMYTRRGRPTKRFDIQAANANRISKPHPLVNGDHASMFDEVQRSGSHDTAPIRVIQIEDDTNGRGKGNKRQCECVKV